MYVLCNNPFLGLELRVSSLGLLDRTCPHGQVLLKVQNQYYAGYRNEYLIVSRLGFTHSKKFACKFLIRLETRDMRPSRYAAHENEGVNFFTPSFVLFSLLHK